MTRPSKWAGALLFIGLTTALAGFAGAAGDAQHGAARLLIVTGRQSTGPELKAADMLRARILKRSAVSVDAVREDDPGLASRIERAELVFALGMPQGNAFSQRLVQEMGMKLPTLANSDKQHPEAFAVKTKNGDGKRFIVIAGTDERGTIYGVGWVLRAMTYLPHALLVPDLEASEQPAFPIRGARPTGPGSRARNFGNLRPQTAEEQTEVMEDLMLLGTNVFEGAPAQVHAYGMLTTFGRTANEMPAGFPKEWNADGGRSTRYVCPSVPEARKALLESFDKQFREMPDYDFFTTNSGDEGGCRCDKCMPWGATYIRLVHEIADILHKYHPNTKVQATNQDLTNEGNQAIFDYLNSGDSSWLYAIRYGPGADEMQTYIRGPVNPRWFEYEGFGPLGNYLQYMHHELPRTTNIVLYSDITHWMQSQYGVVHPDMALATIYDRRSWNARPRRFHAVGQEILHYALGDIHYSEGMHDDFNKWFWYRLLWNPQQDAESITKEYCRYWFGPEAQDAAAKAIFLMEETLEKPVLDNPGIAQAVDLLHAAGRRIPENLLKTDYRWRIILQKALLDRYIQLELQRGRQLKEKAGRILAQVDAAKAPSGHVTKALAVLEQALVTPEMKTVMAEARKLGEESNQAIGYREPAPFLSLDLPKVEPDTRLRVQSGFTNEGGAGTLDLTEVGWWIKMLRQALTEGGDARIRNAVAMVLHYEDPGPGGFYEDVGWPSEAKHLTHGETLWGFLPFPGPARHSYYNLAYAMGAEKDGVTFDYEGLDPTAQYVVRLSVGAHADEESPSMKDMKLVEGLKADETVVSAGFPVPWGEVTFQEFDLPHEVTADGKVQIGLTPQSKAFPVTALYEIWLLRKDQMPWTVRP